MIIRKAMRPDTAVPPFLDLKAWRDGLPDRKLEDKTIICDLLVSHFGSQKCSWKAVESNFRTQPGTSKRRVRQHLRGPILDPFFAETCLGKPPRAAKSDSKITFFGSKSVQERSKRPPRGFLRASASKMRFGPRLGPAFGSPK